MNKSPSLIITLVLLATLLAITPPATSATIDSTLWGAVGAPVEVAPGDTGKAILVTIRNDQQTTYSSVRANLGGSDGMFWPVTGASSATLSGNFAPGDAWSPRFYLNVDPSAFVGQTSALPLTLTMYDRTNSTVVTETLTVRAQITGRALLQVTSDVLDLTAGAEQAITLTVANKGSGPAGNVQLTLTPGNGLTLVAGESLQNLGALAPGTTRSITATVRASNAGASTLSTALAYSDAAGTSATATRSVGFDTAAAEARVDDITARIEESEIRAGRAANVTFLVWNNETTDIREVRVKAAVSGVLVVPDATDEQTLANIPTGTLARVVVHVLTDNDARGIQRVPLTLAWTRADGSNASRTFNLALPLVGTVEPSVTSVTTSINNVTQAATIAGTLTNLGNTQALNAYIQLLGSNAFAATQQQYIGDLSPNTAFPFTLATTVLNTSAINATGPGVGGGPAGAGVGGTASGRGNGTFPVGGGPPATGTFPGNFTRNGTATGGFGGGAQRAGGNTVQVLVTWNDDYGAMHSQIFSVQATPRAATTSARAVTTTSDAGGDILGISYLNVGLIIGALAAAAVGAAYVQKRRKP